MDFEAAGAEGRREPGLAQPATSRRAGPDAVGAGQRRRAAPATTSIRVEPSPGSAVLMQHEGAEGLEASPSALSLARAPLGKESASPRFQQGERFWRALSVDEGFGRVGGMFLSCRLPWGACSRNA